MPRGAGILLPVSSLPSPYGIGALGKAAFAFIDFLKEAGQKYWQVLPVGPTSFGDSPYQSFSAFAGNPYFIDLDTLREEGLLEQAEIDAFDWGDAPDDVDYAKLYQSRFQVLRSAFQRSGHRDTQEYRAFCEAQALWLEDYALYMALKDSFEGHEWLRWPEKIRLRDAEEVELWSGLLEEERDFWKFCQYKFFEQWDRIRTYAKQNGVQIIGDIPIYVALDSADVWVHGELFQLDEQRRPTCVAGVPPDAFSETGQLWGNPLYDWEEMERTDFAWWKARMAHSARLYSDAQNEHLPHNYSQNLAIYGGTHDNETLVGHYVENPSKDSRYAMRYLQVHRRKDIPKAMVVAGYASVANTVLYQIQDLLFLPNSARMNFPSTLGGNWRWRLVDGQLTVELADWLRGLTEIYGR